MILKWPKSRLSYVCCHVFFSDFEPDKSDFDYFKITPKPIFKADVVFVPFILTKGVFWHGFLCAAFKRLMVFGQNFEECFFTNKNYFSIFLILKMVLNKSKNRSKVLKVIMKEAF